MSRLETYFAKTTSGMTKEFMLATKKLFYRFVNRTDHYIITRTIQRENNYDDTWCWVYDIFNKYLGPDRGYRWTFNPDMTTKQQAIRCVTTFDKNRNLKNRLKKKLL